MEWLRWYHGTADDPKWRVVSRRSGEPIHAVLAVWARMLETASQAKPRGTLAGWNDEVTGAGLDLPTEAVAAIREAMQGLTLDGDRLTGWSGRQPKREDGAAERARAWRERNRTHANATERTRTQTNVDRVDREEREEQHTDATHPAGAAVENSAGGEQATDPPEQPAPDEPSDADMYALLAPLIRQHVWLGKGPPDDAPKGWGMGRDLSICRQLMRKGGFSLTDFAGGLTMCRDPTAEEIVPPRKPITMAYFNRAGRMDLIQQLVHAYRKKSDWGPVNVGRILRAAS